MTLSLPSIPLEVKFANLCNHLLATGMANKWPEPQLKKVKSFKRAVRKSKQGGRCGDRNTMVALFATDVISSSVRGAMPAFCAPVVGWLGGYDEAMTDDPEPKADPSIQQQ